MYKPASKGGRMLPLYYLSVFRSTFPYLPILSISTKSLIAVDTSTSKNRRRSATLIPRQLVKSSFSSLGQARRTMNSPPPIRQRKCITRQHSVHATRGKKRDGLVNFVPATWSTESDEQHAINCAASSSIPVLLSASSSSLHGPSWTASKISPHRS